MTARVVAVAAGSDADRAGMRVGDRIASINETRLRDILDYHLTCDEERLRIELLRDGDRMLITLDRDDRRPLGLTFDRSVFNGVRRCANACVFCFVDQLPPGLRPSLYLKDDDYRLSFLYGNFITLTNLSARDVDRIISARLSPLYVSLHSTDPEVRQAMVRSRRRDRSLEYLAKLAAAGLEIHIQIVLCPGHNDGARLDETLGCLLREFEGVSSVGVVPLGLSDHREGLPSLRPVDRGIAGRTLTQIGRWQDKARSVKNSRWVFAADEFYLMAGRPLPADEEYEGYPQLENGIGLGRLLLESAPAERPRLASLALGDARVALVTGTLAAPLVRTALADAIPGDVTVVPVTNRLLGAGVSVAGLLAGEDILSALGDQRADVIVIPSVCLNADRRFLDNMTLSEFESRLGKPVIVAQWDASDLAQGVGDVVKLIQLAVGGVHSEQRKLD